MLSILNSKCPPRQNPAKKSGSTRSEFCEILSPTPPAFRKISLAFRICISAHHILFKRLCGVQSVLPHFCFSRSSVLRTEARKRSGERLWILSAVFDKIGSSGIV